MWGQEHPQLFLIHYFPVVVGNVLSHKEKNSSVGKKNWPECRANLFPPEPEITPQSPQHQCPVLPAPSS